ncbi:helix-turn-helix transcriptional regulator [Deinococcus navajonensis]|uniref:Helix-turn-helix transcriptional regulator n=1 Tax=Deinococcus navajonensis TaxID=309884 RepID=A0ABV8XPM3_9DEIO
MTYDPSLRVLTVLELLQAREEVTGAELAQRLEVSPRTVQRYVARLQDLGIPVEGRRGVGGAYRLRPGFRLPPMMFTPDEALSLSLGLLALRLLGLSQLAPAAGAAQAKLARTLPQTLRETVNALEGAVQLDASPWVVRTDARLLTDVLRAVRERRQVGLTYTSVQGQGTQRVVDLYRAVHLDGRWYAVGWCHLRAERRSFRLDRIGELEVLESAFTPPADFDALAFLRASLPATPATHAVSVWLGASPEALRAQVSLWGTALRAESGGTRFEGQRDNLTSFAAFLLGLGVPLRVDHPPELREEFRALGQRCAVLAGPAMPPTMVYDPVSSAP